MEVSICMITYNQGKYVADAIKSILMQETNFVIDLIISDDASTDDTCKIIAETISSHPKGKIVVRFIEHSKNIGFRKNFVLTLQGCKGKYTAICEGDDYWTDPFKLQKQVDFLEANEDYALCFHQTKTLYEDGTELWYNDLTENKSFDFVDLVLRHYISTVSSVFKNPRSLPEWFEDIASDWPLFLHIASMGKIYYMNECMAVYRRHSGGVFSSLSNDEKYNKTIILLDKLDKIFDYKYHEYFEKSKQARHAIHYPSVIVPPKRSLLSRIKNKIKTTLLSR